MNIDEKIGLAICTAILGGFFAFAALQPYFESRAYNRLTGSQTTYWDAVFVKLRVQSEPK